MAKRAPGRRHDRTRRRTFCAQPLVKFFGAPDESCERETMRRRARAERGEEGEKALTSGEPLYLGGGEAGAQ